MKIEELITALRRLKVETGSLPCLGCGYEHGCSLHGCVIINEALERITMLKEHFSEESALKMAAQALETTPEALRQSAQFHAGDTVWVLTRDEDGVPNDVDGYMLLAVAGNAVIVTSFVDDQDDLDSTLAYRNKSGQSEEVTDDYRLRLLNEETGDLLDAFQWKCTLVRDYLLPGNGYTYVDWVSNRIDGLYYVDPMQVSAEIGADPIFKTARFFIGGRSYRDYEIMRILRNTRDGVTGSGLVAESPIQLETMLNALKYENRMVKTGAKKGFLKVEKDKKVSQTVLDQLRNSWRKMYGPDSEETTVILNDGVDFKDAGQTAVETQLNENKQTNAHEIYRIFNIAPTILEGDATAEDLKNTVRFAIAPVVKALQLAINRFCLLEAEKGVLAFEIDMDALDGTDMLARYQAYEVAIRNGWMQLDEVRYDEGRNPLGLKFIRLGLDTVIYDPESRMIYTPNTKEWASIDQKGGGEPIAGRDPSG